MTTRASQKMATANYACKACLYRRFCLQTVGNPHAGKVERQFVADLQNRSRKASGKPDLKDRLTPSEGPSAKGSDRWEGRLERIQCLARRIGARGRRMGVQSLGMETERMSEKPQNSGDRHDGLPRIGVYWECFRRSKRRSRPRSVANRQRARSSVRVAGGTIRNRYPRPRIRITDLASGLDGLACS
jgi:hypothetical protein